jgi:hypothetical protein
MRSTSWARRCSSAESGPAWAAPVPTPGYAGCDSAASSSGTTPARERGKSAANGSSTARHSSCDSGTSAADTAPARAGSLRPAPSVRALCTIEGRSRCEPGDCVPCARSSSALRARGDDRASSPLTVWLAGFRVCGSSLHAPLLYLLAMVRTACPFAAPRICVFSASGSGLHGSRMDTGEGLDSSTPTPRRLGADLAPTTGLSAPTSFRRTHFFRSFSTSISPPSTGFPPSLGRVKTSSYTMLCAFRFGSRYKHR